MSNWTGKIAGFIIGYMFGGPVSAVFGMFLGHIFDAGGPSALQGLGLGGMSNSDRYAVQQAYFKATFTVMGHIAKADGRVSEDEIRTARGIMKNMNLNQRQKQDAVNLFSMGKQPGFSLSRALDELFQAAGTNQQMLYRMFIDIQFRAAAADGSIGPNKQRILQEICNYFGFSYAEFASFYQQHGAYNYQRRQSTYRGQESSQQHTHRHRPQRPTQESKLEKAYSLLGVKNTQTDAEIKKAYRKKMSENHPDKLISKGLPEEMIKLANQKTSEIKRAYDTIMKSRGKK